MVCVCVCVQLVSFSQWLIGTTTHSHRGLSTSYWDVTCVRTHTHGSSYYNRIVACVWTTYDDEKEKWVFHTFVIDDDVEKTFREFNKKLLLLLEIFSIYRRRAFVWHPEMVDDDTADIAKIHFVLIIPQAKQSSNTLKIAYHATK